MKKLFTLIALSLIMVMSAQAALNPVRITVTTTPNLSGAQLTVDVLNANGSALATPISINKGAAVVTDAGGVLSFLLTEAAWTGATYNKDYLVRVTYGSVVLSIERMEVVYNKQGLFGALIDPNEINGTGTAGYVLATDGTNASWSNTFSGTSTNSTNAANTGITDNTALNATVYPTWVTGNSGNLPQEVSSTKLFYNPSTGMFTSTGGFTGNVTGTASNAAKVANTLSATNTSLTFTGSYDGSVARTVGLNVGNTNTWSVVQYFTNGIAQASSTPAWSISAAGTAAFNGNVTLGDAAADLITVNGTIRGGSPLVFDGTTAGGFTTTFALPDPATQNQTITFPDASGTVMLTTNIAANMADLTATDATLTFSGAYDGSAARTVGLNLSNSNTWLATQTFQTILPSATNLYNLGSAGTSWANIYANGVTVNPYGAFSHNTGSIYLKELAINGSNYVGLRAADALASDMVYSLPVSAPTVNGQMLVSQTDGTMSWTSLDPNLVQFASLPSTAGNFIVGSAGGWIVQSPVQVRTILGAEPVFTHGDLSSTDIAVAGGAGRLVGGNTTLTINKGNLVSGADPDDVIDVTGGTNAVLGGGVTLKVKKASGTQAGYLSAADWTTFNSKLNYDAKLADIAAMDLSGSAGYMLASNGTTFLLTSPPDIKTNLSLNNVNNTSDLAKPISTLTQAALDGKQPLDADLTRIAGFTHTAGNIMVSDGTQWVLQSGLTARQSLGLGTMSTQNSNAVAITGGTIDGTAIGTTTRAAGAFTHVDVQPMSGTLPGTITLFEEPGTTVNGAVTLSAPSDIIGLGYTLTYPTVAPVINQFLVSDASGQYSWSTFDKSALGLSNVTNDKQIPWSYLGDPLANKVATLDGSGKVPASQLNTPPTIITTANYASLILLTGAANTLYVTSDLKELYVWSGGGPNDFAKISTGLALGETHAEAYYGDLGKKAYTHSITHGPGATGTIADSTAGNPHRMVKADIGLGNVENTQLSTWPGTDNIETIGAVTIGEWKAKSIADAYVDNNLTIDGGTINNSVIGATAPVTGTFRPLRLAGATSGFVTLQAPATTANYTLTMPDVAPAVSQFLINDPTTPGLLRWANILPTDVGLGNVNNTSDANKPISTLTQAALDGKQPLDADLTRLAALTLTADQMYYTTAGNILAALPTSSYGRGLLNTANAAGLQAALGLTIGVDIQAWDTQLDQIAALIPTNGSFMVGNGTAWVLATATDVRTAIQAQPLAANLTNLATMGTAADMMLYSTGVHSWAEKLTTSFGREFLALVNASDACTYLGLTIGTTVQAWDHDLDVIAAMAPTNGSIIIGNGTNWVTASGASAATALGAQPLDPTLTSIATRGTTADRMLYTTGVDSWAELTTTAYGRSLLNTANGPAVRTLIGLGTIATENTGAIITSIVPSTDNSITLGDATHRWSNVYATTFTGAFAGNATTATTLATPRSIYGNNFDGSAALAQIIASTYGGTGNGFTKFSGPAGAEKTFTLPNASATILTDNAVVTSAQGGTGINNGGRTLTISTNSGTIAYSNAATTLTVANTASVSGTNTGDQTTITGNAGTATVLQTSRNIYGNSFNGSADVTAVISPTYGGTGVNNGSNTLTITSNPGTIAYSNASTTLTVANTASVSGTNTGDVTISATPHGLSLAGQVLSLSAANTSTTGALTSTDWNTFNDKPTLSSGTTAPSSTPAKVGDIYVDITAKKIYIATGTASSADWTVIN